MHPKQLLTGILSAPVSGCWSDLAKRQSNRFPNSHSPCALEARVSFSNGRRQKLPQPSARALAAPLRTAQTRRRPVC